MKAPELYYVEGPLPETPEVSTDLAPWGETEVVGKPDPRVDAYERVSGSAVYPSDVTLPGMLYGAILRCPHPHALLKAIDASVAEGLPGVRAVLTGSSPEAAKVRWHYGRTEATALFDPECLYEGEAVAAVAAETPYQAQDALRAIRVEYAVLPFVCDERRALHPGAPDARAGGNKVGPEQVYERGDVAAGFSAADVVLEQDYRTACEIHTPMELHGCVAKWDGRRLTVWESTQGVFRIQSQVAQVLDMPLSSVRVIGHYMGGGFGSKLQAGKYTVIAALLAKQAARPVKLFLTREETFLTVGNRPPNTMHLKAGVKRNGTLTALEFRGLGTGGAYPAGGTGALDWLVRDLYTCPNVRCTTQDVFVNAGPSRPFRAPGHPQGAWALEQMMDALAEAIHMDPVELRLKNIPTVSQGREGNPPYTTTGLKECIAEGAKAFGWGEARTRPRDKGLLRRGVGMGAAEWVAGGGGPPSTIIVKLFADGSVNLNMGASDIGTGTKTVMAMVVSEELGVPLERIQVENADTGTTEFATPSGGSKTVPTESPAVRAAAVDAKQQLLAMAGEDLKLPAGELALRGDEIVSTSDPTKRIKVAEVSGLARRGVVMGVGYRGPNPEGKVVSPFAAQFCEVEVDTSTGVVRVLRFVGAHESGRVLNRMTYENQVWGGITMGIGFACTEQRVLDEGQTGKLVNRNWHDYKLPTAEDVPSDMSAVTVDLHDQECNATGAKGLGEPVTIPTAAAVANAVYHATGVRVTETPISPMRLVQLLAEQRRKEG
jgi:CO/xanthine dehydrogenase Mo-binding subunit